MNWGDLTPPESFAVGAQGAISRNHTYDDNGTYTVSVTVTDKDGGVSIPPSTFQVTVNNVAPTATLTNTGRVDEGSPATVSFSGQSGSVHRRYDGRIPLTRSAAHNGDLSGATYASTRNDHLDDLHSYADNGSHTVTAPDHRQGRRVHGATRAVVVVNNCRPGSRDRQGFAGALAGRQLGDRGARAFTDPGTARHPHLHHQLG